MMVTCEDVLEAARVWFKEFGEYQKEQKYSKELKRWAGNELE